MYKPPNHQNYSFEDKLDYLTYKHHVRNAKMNKDGSIGEMILTPVEMRELVEEVRATCEHEYTKVEV